MNREDLIRMARLSGMPLKPLDDDYCDMVGLERGTICRVSDVGVKELQLFAELVAEAERRKHQTDIETWKAEAATAEKWSGMALAKDPMQPGKSVQEIQRESMEMERAACLSAALCTANTLLRPLENVNLDPWHVRRWQEQSNGAMKVYETIRARKKS